MGYSCLLCKKPSYLKFRSQVTFHAFPKCPIQKQVWLNMCNITNPSKLDLKYRKICSFHFEPECFEENKKRRLLKSDAVPTIFVSKFMKKELFESGIWEDTPKLHKGRNNCILCMKSEISYLPKIKIPLHSFPTCEVRRQEWINRCQLTDEEISPNDKICALHFEDTCYKPKGLRSLLNPDAVPTIFEMGRYYNRKRSSSGTPIKVKKMTVDQTNNDHVREVKREYYPTTMDQTTELLNDSA